MSQLLSAGGIVIVSMKHDDKSKVLFGELRSRMQWVNAILYQEKNVGPDFAIRHDDKRPGYLVAAVRPLA